MSGFGTRFRVRGTILGHSSETPKRENENEYPPLNKHHYGLQFDDFGFILVRSWSSETHLGSILGFRDTFFEAFSHQEPLWENTHTHEHRTTTKHGGGHCAAAQLDPRGALGAPQACETTSTSLPLALPSSALPSQHSPPQHFTSLSTSLP